MAIQNINRGTSANDGTGDTARAGALKINENFAFLYNAEADFRVVLGPVLASNNLAAEAATVINASSPFTFPFANLGFIKYIEYVNGDIENIYFFKITKIGGGASFGTGGTVSLISDNLFLTGQKPKSVEDFQALNTTVTEDFGDIGTTTVIDYINGLSPAISIQATSVGATILKAIVNGEQQSFLFKGTGGDYGAGALQLVASDLEALNESSSVSVTITNITEIPNRSYNDLQDLPSLTDVKNSYAELLYKKVTTDFSTYTLTENFELIDAGVDQVYFCHKNTLNLDFRDTRIKINANNKSSDLVLPDLAQSNYVAYLVQTPFLDSLLYSNTYSFTFWREKSPIRSITEIPDRSYNDLQDLPNLSGLGVQNRFLTITELLSNQNIQSNRGIQYVDDASTDTTVDAGFAYYEYLGTTAGTLSDYRKLSEEESMDVVQSAGGDQYAVASGTNTYSVTLNSSLTAYTAGLGIKVKFTNPNTGASTLNVDGLGAKTILIEGKTVKSGDLSGVCIVIYDGTNFQVQKRWQPNDPNRVVTTDVNGEFETINETVDLYLTPIDDSAGIKTSAELNTAYPNAFGGNRVRGSSGVYENFQSFGWVYFNFTIV